MSWPEAAVWCTGISSAAAVVISFFGYLSTRLEWQEDDSDDVA